MIADPISTLLQKAKAYYRAHGRAHLPWRKTKDPYTIMVSEVMLQQTQAERVVPFYNAFIKKYPNAKRLAAADLPDVLKLWNGLGYNRRAKMLRDAAKIIVEKFDGRFPNQIKDIESLPGVGPYSARAVAAFAYNAPEVFIETNIRTAFIHHCFRRSKKEESDNKFMILHNIIISDAQILPLVGAALKQSKMEPREFYAMLMDYGSFLKKSGIKLNAKSKHYTKQSKFEGSRRQLRGQILKLLLQHPATEKEIFMIYHNSRKLSEVQEELAKLEKEKLILQKRGKYTIGK